MIRRSYRRIVAFLLVLVPLSCAGLINGQPAFAVSHALIQGTGSSWAQNAVNQWISDVSSSGLQVVFTGSGSAQGRKDFANGITDFAVSDIGYQGSDPVTGEQDTNCPSGPSSCRAFAYEPIVAGGTSFPYQIRVGGQAITNLRLSGLTLAKIFTYQITNWDDPAITKDNNGRKLPDLHIIPVVHSEGSGSTAQFTAFLAKEYPSIWQNFVHTSGPTEYWPPPSGGQGIAQSGSDGVMNFVSSASANGAIGYDEYSYPLAKGNPVAKIENKDGYFTLPDQYNVAVALRHAQINMNKSSQDYLLQNLANVYSAPEPQVYPLSSYSYFLIPTASNDPRMTTAKRQTLADYLYYSVCQGQKEMGPIGYSPLPINLVQASFAQTAKLKQADPGVDLTKRDVTTCHNPTFVAGHPEVNRLAQIAPVPPACDKAGQGPCGTANTGTGGNPPGSTGGSTGGNTGGSTGGSTGSTTGSKRGGTTGGSGGTTGSGTTPGVGGSTTGGTQPGTGGTVGTPGGGTGTAGTVINPDTGQVVSGSGTTSGPGALAVSTQLAAYRQQDMSSLLGPLVVLELLGVLAVPPVVYLALRRRKRATS